MHGKGLTLFLEYIKNRIESNKNFICFVIGGTGSGKSYSALSIGNELSTRYPTLFNFSIKTVIFTPKDLISAVKDEPKGTVIIPDEFGVQMDSRTFQSKINKILSYVMQTMRFKNHVILITVPNSSFVDVSARKLCHCVLKTEKIHKRAKLATLSPRLTQIDYDSGKIYYKCVRAKLPKEGVVAVGTIKVKIPPPAMTKEYEQKRKKWCDEMYDVMVTELSDTKPEKTGMTFVDVLVWEYIKKYRKDNQKNPSIEEISNGINRSEPHLKRNLVKLYELQRLTIDDMRELGNVPPDKSP